MHDLIGDPTVTFPFFCVLRLVHQDALQLVICYLYQDAGVFEKQTAEAAQNVNVGVSVNGNASKGPPVLASNSFKTETTGESTTRSEPDRARDRRDHILSMRSRAGLPNADGEELAHGTAATSLDPWGDGEHEAAAGFGSFGGAYGSSGKYDGAGLDRLMSLMSAARTLKLGRLQVYADGVAVPHTVVLGVGAFVMASKAKTQSSSVSRLRLRHKGLFDRVKSMCDVDASGMVF